MGLDSRVISLMLRSSQSGISGINVRTKFFRFLNHNKINTFYSKFSLAGKFIGTKEKRHYNVTYFDFTHWPKTMKMEPVELDICAGNIAILHIAILSAEHSSPASVSVVLSYYTEHLAQYAEAWNLSGLHVFTGHVVWGAEHICDT